MSKVTSLKPAASQTYKGDLFEGLVFSGLTGYAEDKGVNFRLRRTNRVVTATSYTT